MIEKTVQPAKSLGFTTLYLDFLAGTQPARSFYSDQGVDQISLSLDSGHFERDTLVHILKRQNEDFKNSTKAFSTIEKLKNPKSVCIFAGQQAGFLGGPLLTLLKGLAIVKEARKLTRALKRPVIPIFWIAGDDHDFSEVNNTFILDKQGDLAKIEYPTPPEHEYPIGQVRFHDSDSLLNAHNRLKEILGNTDYSTSLYEMIGYAYKTDDTFVTSFGKLLASLTGDYGLVLFSPNDPDVKQLAVPFFKSVLDKQNEIHDAVSNRNLKIVNSEYHLQVHKQDNATHLFIDIDGRKPIHRSGDDFTAGERVFTREALNLLIDKEPERFSPDVITRAQLQSFLFPVAVQMGGPSEIAYFAQANVLFDLFDRPMPFHMARPSVILMEKRVEKLMTEFDIQFEEIAGDIELLINRVLVKSFPEGLDKEFGQLRSDIFNRFEQFSEQSISFDPSLRDFAKQTFSKIDFTLKTFEEKLFASHKRRSKETRDRIYRLKNAIYPNNALPDRSLNVSYFIAKHGPGIISLIYDKLDPARPAPKIVSLSEMDA